MNELGVDDYEIKEWIVQLGSMPIKRVAHADYCECYQMCVAHVFLLENGKYAVVFEEGCSCYVPEHAVIDVLPDLATAMKKFDEWKIKQKKYQ